MIYRRISFATFLTATLFAVVPRAAVAEDSEKLLLDYIDVWNTGEVERLDDIVSPDFKRHSGPDESTESGAGLAEIIRQARTIYGRLQITVVDHMTSGDRGALRGTFYGVHRKVNGVVEFPMMSLLRFVDGHIAEEWIVGDNFLSLVVLGYELVPPGFEAIPPTPDPASSGVNDGR